MIRVATHQDLEEIVTVHLRSFPGFFLTFLGRRFLALLYRSLTVDPEGIVLVSIGDEQVDGFVSGTTNQPGFYRRLVSRHLLAFGASAAGALLRRPSIFPRLVRALRRPGEAERSSAQACLMSLGVRPDAQGKGVGGQLVRAFSEAMSERGVGIFCLSTDARDNDQVNRFYQSIGFRLVRQYDTPEGRAMNEYLFTTGS
jgi:ribosomal protein S18 acetylase RimI-like enzyme